MSTGTTPTAASPRDVAPVGMQPLRATPMAKVSPGTPAHLKQRRWLRRLEQEIEFRSKPKVTLTNERPAHEKATPEKAPPRDKPKRPSRGLSPFRQAEAFTRGLSPFRSRGSDRQKLLERDG
jgi:hypothetical protein